MNHIARLIQERDQAQDTIRQAFEMLTELERYLCSDKFHNADYVHVRTDMLPKISAVRFKLIEG